MDISAMRIRPVDPQPVPCKVCAAPAALFGVQDFNRSCEEHRGKYLPLSGVPIYYRRCGACGLIFTDAFDDWADEEFAAYIYNDGYLAIDPDYETSRPTASAALVTGTFVHHKASLDVLDYGGGNGCFADTILRNGFRSAHTYDRFHPAHRARPDGTFNLVTCFETLEHMPDPKAGAAEIVSFMPEDGLLILSTLVQPQDILQSRLHWWYIAARNGHITLFSYQALARLFSPFGLTLYPTDTRGTHFLCRRIPDFARDMMRNAKPVLL